MAPTLYQGDVVLVLRYFPARFIKRNDIVVLSSWWPDYPLGRELDTHDALRIKRVVGLAGDILVENSTPSNSQREFSVMVNDSNDENVSTISKGFLFVCGDNPTGSRDSRIWGPIPQGSVVGIVVRQI